MVAAGARLPYLAVSYSFLLAACGDPATPRYDAGLPPSDSGPADSGADADVTSDADVPDPTAPRLTMRFEKILAGTDFACGIVTGGSMRCWGEQAPAEEPTFTGPVLDACLFEQHMCALTDGGRIECLNLPDFFEPPTLTDFVSLECMDVNTCARRANGERVCWGGMWAKSFETSQDFVRYDGCNQHACGLNADGSFECLGNLPFELGEPRSEPFTALASGAEFNCGLTRAGSIDCWGLDVSGRLDAPGGTGFIALDASFRSGCALREDRTPACWGSSAFWDTTPAVPLSSVSVGQGFACGLTADESRGVCWGIPSDGQTEVPLEGT